MEQITLTGSFVQRIGRSEHTFFIAQQEGSFGILSAGSWETVLPFCFEEIHACCDNLLSVKQNGRRSFLYLACKKDQICAIPLPSGPSAQRGAICLPA